MSAEHLLDVSGLEPPEPLERALEAAAALPAGGYVRMQHRREPVLLYPLLAERGFRWSTRAGAATAFEIFIWRGADAAAECAVRAAGVR